MGHHEKDEKEFFSTMCQSLPDPTLFISEKEIIKKVSESAAEIVDHPRKELIGKHFTDFFDFLSKENQEEKKSCSSLICWTASSIFSFPPSVRFSIFGKGNRGWCMIHNRRERETVVKRQKGKEK